MAATETVKSSPLDARIDGVGREIADGNLWIALPGLKTLLAEAQMTDDGKALRKIAVLAVRAEADNPDKTRRALGEELGRLRLLAGGVEEDERRRLESRSVATSSLGRPTSVERAARRSRKPRKGPARNTWAVASVALPSMLVACAFLSFLVLLSAGEALDFDTVVTLVVWPAFLALPVAIAGVVFAVLGIRKAEAEATGSNLAGLGLLLNIPLGVLGIFWLFLS